MTAKTIPVLRIFDVKLAESFYLDYLGMKKDWEYKISAEGPVYMQVSKGAFCLHLSGHYGDCSPGAKVFIQLDQLDEWFQALSKQPNDYCCPDIETAPWGARYFLLTDPFSNRLWFQET